jgi:hypothetical protein
LHVVSLLELSLLLKGILPSFQGFQVSLEFGTHAHEFQVLRVLEPSLRMKGRDTVTVEVRKILFSENLIVEKRKSAFWGMQRVWTIGDLASGWGMGLIAFFALPEEKLFYDANGHFPRRRSVSMTSSLLSFMKNITFGQTSSIPGNGRSMVFLVRRPSMLVRNKRV